MAIEPIKGFYVHDEESNTDGVAQIALDAIEGVIQDDIAPAVTNWLDDHPEATTTVQDDSLTTAKYKDGSVTPAKMADFSTGYKSNAGIVEQLNVLNSKTLPSITNFGPLTLETVNTILNNDNIKTLRCSGTLTVDTPIVIERPITLLCEQFYVMQTTWGFPGIIINSDNVQIFGELNVICDVTQRTAITDPTYHADNGDPKSDSAGIMLGYQNAHKNFYCQRANIYNFIGGLTNLSTKFENIVVDYLYIENVDFGVFGSNYINAHFGVVDFKNIASYIGSEDPSHAVYLTGGSTPNKSINVTVDKITGDGCESKKTDTVISVKSVANFKCNGGFVSNISGLCSALVSTGIVKDVIVNSATSCFSTQLAQTDFTYQNIVFYDITVSDEYLIYCTTGSICRNNDCKFNIISDDENNEYIYTSGSSEYYEKNCKYNSPVNSEATLYKRNNTETKFYVIAPEANIILFDGTLDPDKAYTLLDPGKLNFPKTNCLVPNPHFIENNIVVDEQTATKNHPVGFRTNDKVRVTEATVYDFNTNNITNGVVYTLINDGTSQIVNGDRLKTKTGANYSPADWTIFRFMNIGNVAYEI